MLRVPSCTSLPTCLVIDRGNTKVISVFEGNLQLYDLHTQLSVFMELSPLKVKIQWWVGRGVCLELKVKLKVISQVIFYHSRQGQGALPKQHLHESRQKKHLWVVKGEMK